MKKQLKICLIFITILSLCILIINFIKDRKTNDSSNNYIDHISIKEINKYEIINKDNKPYTIYYYGINSVLINLDNNEYQLINAIKENKITLDEMFNEMEIYAELNDGGTKIYRNSNLQLFKENYTIIKCNTIDGNKDIYVGDNEMKYIESFCKYKATEAEINLQIETLKLFHTTKIKVVSTNNKVTKKIITDKNKINKIIDIISNAEEIQSNIVTSELNNYNLLVYDKKANLIKSISIWNNGYLGFNQAKTYYLSSKNDINTIKEIIE